ncbi:SulP family inorganic anion transporter [Phormidium tenue FACHB-886]|nr:SulP family inorganic anion transporter [Phormidium tenue FACHB-886]
MALRSKFIRVAKVQGIHRLRKKQPLQLANLQTELLAGITVALALIPESLAFAAIANVSPMVALYTSFCMAVVTAIAGGRPAMISAATGSMALLMVTLVAKHGVEYLFAATVLTGIIQFLIGVFRFDRFFHFIPSSVIAGFINALGSLIFLAQLQQFAGEPWQMPVMVAVTLAIVYLLPRFSQQIPAPLVAIVTMTAAANLMSLPIRRVGDIGEISRALPSFHLPAVSFSLETLTIILPYALALAIVGLLESLLTAGIVDELTHTQSSLNQEVRGQGIANVITGLLGGMAGCGMVGQSIINVRSGGRSRLSTGVAGAFLLFAIFALRDTVQQIPMAALVGVMIMVAFETFSWKSLKTLRTTPLPDSLVMPFTAAIALWTHDLAQGVLGGVVLSTLLFGWRAAQLKVVSAQQNGIQLYYLSGQLFAHSTSHLIQAFDYTGDPQQIVLDFSDAHLWDRAAAEAVLTVIQKYQRLQKQVTIVGLNPDSQTIAQQAGVVQDVESWNAGSAA